MQVSTWVKEAIDEALLYATLEHRPDVSLAFRSLDSPALRAFADSLDASFFNVFNQSCGYYQLKRFAATHGEAVKLSFIEDATEFRLLECGRRRMQRALAIVAAYSGAVLFRADTPLDLSVGGGALFAAPNLASMLTLSASFSHISPSGEAVVPDSAHGSGCGPNQYCALPRGNNLAAVLERLSTHLSEEAVSRGSPRRTAHTTADGSVAGSPLPRYLHPHPLSFVVRTPGAESDAPAAAIQQPPSALGSDLSDSGEPASYRGGAVRAWKAEGAVPATDDEARGAATFAPSVPLDLSLSIEGEESLREALDRSSRHLNGVPCFLLQAFRSYGYRMRPPRVLWASVVAQIARISAAAVASGNADSAEAPRALFDEVVVLATHAVQMQLFSPFLASACFGLYANMLHFAFSRPQLSRDAFVWLRPLGRGGYGMVYAAQRVDSGKLYAVKCMDKRLIKARHATRMIMNERDVLASVSHPFVTGLQYAFHDEAEVFFALDLQTGGDLEYYLLHMARPFTEEEVRFFMAEILLGVSYLHAHGIMHRDLKPANILISHEGHVSISDLGLAAFFAPQQAQLQAQQAQTMQFAQTQTQSPPQPVQDMHAGAALARAKSMPTVAAASPSVPTAAVAAAQPKGAMVASLAGADAVPGPPQQQPLQRVQSPLSPGLTLLTVSPFLALSQSLPSIPLHQPPVSTTASTLPSSPSSLPSPLQPFVSGAARQLAFAAGIGPAPLSLVVPTPVLAPAAIGSGLYRPTSGPPTVPTLASGQGAALLQVLGSPTLQPQLASAFGAEKQSSALKTSPPQFRGAFQAPPLVQAKLAASLAEPLVHPRPALLLPASGASAPSSRQAKLAGTRPRLASDRGPERSRERTRERQHEHGSFAAGGSLWDVGLSFAATDGAGVSACEEAGFTFGSQEGGIRGKAGTPGFWAPEMLYYERDGKGRRYGPAADWWSFGCLLYALLAARGPFTVVGGDTADDNNATLQLEPDLSLKIFSPVAASLLHALLQKDPRRRLGGGPGGAADVMAHPFFEGIDWAAVLNRQVAPPFRPTLNVLESAKAVRGWSDKDKVKLQGVVLSSQDQAKYAGVPFSSQVAVYKGLVQNLALREYIESEIDVSGTEDGSSVRDAVAAGADATSASFVGPRRAGASTTGAASVAAAASASASDTGVGATAAGAAGAGLGSISGGVSASILSSSMGSGGMTGAGSFRSGAGGPGRSEAISVTASSAFASAAAATESATAARAAAGSGGGLAASFGTHPAGGSPARVGPAGALPKRRAVSDKCCVA